MSNIKLELENTKIDNKQILKYAEKVEESKL